RRLPRGRASTGGPVMRNWKDALGISALILLVFVFALTGCATVDEPQPGTRVVFQEVDREVQRPCPAVKPERPAPLEKPLPASLSALVDVLTAKLMEWAGSGMYGDRAEAALELCTRKD